MAVRKRIGMAESRDWTHWHLTPRGWFPGAWARDERQDLTVAPPADRVLTYEYSEYQLPNSKRVPLVREVWRIEEFVRAVDLLAKWGEPPKRLYVPRARDGRRGRELGP